MQPTVSPQSENSVVIAMSGGVDSCAAALMLAEQGYSVVGVSMQVWDYRKGGGNSSRATCCAPSDFEDAREIADSRGFPFYVFDFEDSFYDAVIQPFVNAYLEGKTPNPCLDCNRKVKFRELRKRGKQFGARFVATGHYAQIKSLPDGSFGLYTSVDTEKDQSYFLYELTQDDLASTLFPVGGLKKPQVRHFLEERGFHIASKGESQDICFVGSTVPEFIEKELGRKPPGGKLVDTNGQELGKHDGIYRFTVGQRRGLKVSSPEPLYVLDIDSQENLVTIGRKSELQQDGFLVDQVNWISGQAPTSPIQALVKLRYRHPGVLCELHPVDETRVRARFVDEWTAVSPGQAAVFYEPVDKAILQSSDNAAASQRVLGGGRIIKGGVFR